MKGDRIILGFTIAVLGMVWLLVNLGLIQVETARELWRYWPVLLVLWGIVLLSGKGGSAFGCLVPILIIAFIFTGVFTFLPFQRNLPVQTYETTMPAERVSSVRLNIAQNAGELLLSSQANPELFRGRFRSDTGGPEIRTLGGTEVKEITVRDTSGYTIGRKLERWEIWLAEQMPAEVRVKTGATRADIDLRKLMVTELSVTAGAGDLTVRLGGNDIQINLESGAGSITIEVPETTGVRLRVDGGLVSVEGKDAGIVSIGDRRYESRDIGQKQAVADIHITAGAGSVTLKQPRR